jgi:hypothetical protein
MRKRRKRKRKRKKRRRNGSSFSGNKNLASILKRMVKRQKKNFQKTWKKNSCGTMEQEEGVLWRDEKGLGESTGRHHRQS